MQGTSGFSGSGGTGSGTVTETEVDFGTTPTRHKSFTITDAGVTAASNIVAVQSGKAPTGKSADENEMDSLLFNCDPATGTFTLRGFAKDGPVVDKYKVNYIAG
jgi:hypothetical protein